MSSLNLDLTISNRDCFCVRVTSQRGVNSWKEMQTELQRGKRERERGTRESWRGQDHKPNPPTSPAPVMCWLAERDRWGRKVVGGVWGKREWWEGQNREGGGNIQSQPMWPKVTFVPVSKPAYSFLHWSSGKNWASSVEGHLFYDDDDA